MSDGRALGDQTEHLVEDLLQVSYGDSVLVDVGWYPDSDPAGEFLVLVVVDRDWDQPAATLAATSIDELRERVQDAVELACRLVKCDVGESGTIAALEFDQLVTAA